MKNPATMTPIEKDSYIFAKDQSQVFPSARFAWISDCLLGDIRTFWDGIENYLHNKSKLQDRGGGNLSVPVIISTALEFVSALYAGENKYRDGTPYNATKNVQEFINHFFPDNYKKFPLLLWDGIRNGIVHTFSPKAFEYQGRYVRFQFYVEDRNIKAHVVEVNNTILIKVNVFELYQITKKAIEKYRVELKTNEELKDKFILAWSSVEEHSRNIDSDNEKTKEAKTLLAELKKANNYLVL